MMHLTLILHEEVHQFLVCLLHLIHAMAFWDAMHHTIHALGVLLHVMITH